MHTADVGGGSLAGTQFITLRDDRLVAQNAPQLGCIVDEDFNFGGHGSRTSQSVASGGFRTRGGRADTVDFSK